jgi:N-hydroxyarylamine O-acetyltransferase
MTFDVDAYLDRLGRTGGRTSAPPTRKTLAALMRAHIRAIPFENLDPLSGRAPSLKLDDLAGKLVSGNRGGYCYEHNTLFDAVLRELGFRVTLHAGRVLLGAREGMIRPRTHMLLFVHFDDEPAPYVADVGFGSIGCLLEPIRLVADAELEDTPRRHRLVRGEPGDGPPAPGYWVLQAHSARQWVGQYAFTEELFQPPDYQVFNWYVATYPDSPFRRALYVQREFGDRHLSLSGTTLTETAVNGTEKIRELTGDELVPVLRTEFGIDVPDYFPLAPGPDSAT